MPILLHEIRRNKLSLIIWSLAISYMLAITVFIFPEMSSQMGDFGEMFSEMGAFSEAFGMDQLNFGEFIDYFGIECSNTLGLGGAIFAALLGASALAKEEKEHTAEFLLTHPARRSRIITEKLLGAIAQIFILNATVIAIVSVSILAINETVSVGTIALIFLSHVVLQLEICAITFCISAFMRRGEVGAGLGIVFGMYFINIIANLTEEAEPLKFITPYSYADGAYIINNTAIEAKYLIAGIAISVICITATYLKYTKKDIA